MSPGSDSTSRLADNVDRVLSDFAEAARAALGNELRSIVLYGSGAEGKLRPTSDVNAIVVLSAFDPAKANALREPLRTAYAAVRLNVMFLLEGEVALAVDAFAVKFADIKRRRRVLFGADPFANLVPSRAAEIARLKQVLLNLTIRLRQRYLLRSIREEQSAAVIADVAGPLRACAASLLDLRGASFASPKEALQQVATSLPGSDWNEVLAHITDAREHGALASGIAERTVLRLIDLAREIRTQVEALK